MRKVDPRIFNLSGRINIQENDKNEVFFIIDRKSRIIMKDGIRIFKQIQIHSKIFKKICKKNTF